MEFSVLMSVYAKEKPEFLKQAIDSVIAEQTLKPSELVLIEDGPLTEELYQVIEELVATYPVIKVHPLKKNVGLGKALQFGLEKCSYNWVARMDSDDIAMPERFAKQVEFLQQHPEVDVLGSNITEFNRDITDVVSVKQMPSTHVGILNMLKRRTPICHVTVMFKKSAVLAAGSYLDLPFVEDYYLWARMAAQGAQFYSLDDSLVYVRVGNGMVARRGNKKQIDSWKVVNQFLRQHQLISPMDGIINMLLIRLFVYMPVGIKAFIYKNLLRKKQA